MDVALWTVFVLVLLAGLWILGTWPSPLPADGAWWRWSPRAGAADEGSAAAKARTTEARAGQPPRSRPAPFSHPHHCRPRTRFGRR
ncbi:MAG TPA: hypothetical protein VGJ44_28800 [Kribbellaceae bacterium]|jgi:hypothetical protein